MGTRVPSSPLKGVPGKVYTGTASREKRRVFDLERGGKKQQMTPVALREKRAAKKD